MKQSDSIWAVRATRQDAKAINVFGMMVIMTKKKNALIF